MSWLARRMASAAAAALRLPCGAPGGAALPRAAARRVQALPRAAAERGLPRARWLATMPGETGSSASRGGNFGGGPVTWRALAVLTALGGGAAFYVHLEREKRRIIRERRSRQAKGAAALGGDFELVDTEGQPFHSDRLRGGWTILYFGFTFCPDICPEELDKLTECLTILEATPDMPTITPVFISIDPGRDTPDKVKEYIQDFHPRMIGLTGTEEQARAAAKAYRVYYSKPKVGDSDDYLVDHSIIMYLVDPDGGFVAYYGQNVPAPEMAAGIAKEIAARGKGAGDEEQGLLDLLVGSTRRLVGA